MMTAMRSPLRVFSCRIDAMMPPIATSTPLSRRYPFAAFAPASQARALVHHRTAPAPAPVAPVARCTSSRQLGGRLRAERFQLGRHAIDRMTAEVQPERLLFVSQLLHFGPRLDVRRPGRRSRRRPPSSCDVPPNSCAWPSARSRCRRAPYSQARSIVAISRARSSPSDASFPVANESNAPAFTRLSSTRLLTSRRSSSSQSACIDVICPLRRAHAQDRRDRAFADVLHRRQAEPHALRRHGERQAGSC